jgi:hypothetical protein
MKGSDRMLKRIMVILLVFSFTLMSLTACGKKQPVTQNTLPEGSIVEKLFTLDEVKNMAVSVAFDKAPPDIAFINPQDELILSESVHSNVGTTWAEYFLPEAEIGKWQVVYMKGENKNVKFSCESYVYEVGISNFVANPAGTSSMPIKFTVSSGTNGTCAYKITAFASDDENAPEILLQESVAQLNKEITKDVSIKKLPDGTILPDGGYKIKLYVSLEYDGEIVTDEMVAPSYILTVRHSASDETDVTSVVTETTTKAKTERTTKATTSTQIQTSVVTNTVSTVTGGNVTNAS